MAPEGAPPFGRVAVLGLGLMGGSLARALRARTGPPVVVGWSPDRGEGARALGEGALDALGADPGEAADGADLVVIATPLAAALELVAELPAFLAPGALLTDVVSLKTPVRDAVRRAELPERWVGSHPMCGSERSGFGASRADLYAGARVWLVVEGAHEADVEGVESFWRSVGARPSRTGAEEHDALMALVSHLPQLGANGLARVLADAGVRVSELGPGGRDATRLAASSPTVWRDLLAHAPDSLAGALRELASRMDELADLIDREDLDALESWMAATRAWRSDG